MDDKKKYIIENTKKLQHDKIVALGLIIERSNLSDNFTFNAVGAFINLDVIEQKDPNIISQLYKKIKEWIE